MIRRIVKPALSILNRTARPLLVNSIRPSYSFANDIQATSKFRSALQKQIKDEQQNRQDLKEFTNYFQNQGWKVRYDGIQIELLKKNGLYNLRMLLNARVPMSDYQPQQELSYDKIQRDYEYSQIAVYLKKDGTQKWLALDYHVYNNSQNDIQSAAFITDYEAEKNERKKGRTLDGQYEGPEIQNLDEQLFDSFQRFLQTTGINDQILQRASKFGIAYQQQFYLGWLKDLQRIV